MHELIAADLVQLPSGTSSTFCSFPYSKQTFLQGPRYKTAQVPGDNLRRFRPGKKYFHLRRHTIFPHSPQKHLYPYAFWGRRLSQSLSVYASFQARI